MIKGVNNLNLGKKIQQIQQTLGDNNKKNDKVENFSKVLKKHISDVNDLQNTADKKIENFIEGDINSVDEVMVSLQEADMAFNLLMQIRNKLVDAYEKLMRTSI